MGIAEPGLVTMHWHHKAGLCHRMYHHLHHQLYHPVINQLYHRAELCINGCMPDGVNEPGVRHHVYHQRHSQVRLHGNLVTGGISDYCVATMLSGVTVCSVRGTTKPGAAASEC